MLIPSADGVKQAIANILEDQSKIQSDRFSYWAPTDKMKLN